MAVCGKKTCRSWQSRQPMTAELTMWVALVTAISFSCWITLTSVFLWWRAHLCLSVGDLEEGTLDPQRLRKKFALQVLESFASAPKSSSELDHEQACTCAICLSDLPCGKRGRKHIQSLPCGHRYHKPCFLEWCVSGYGIQQRRIQWDTDSHGADDICPLCRQTYPGDTSAQKDEVLIISNIDGLSSQLRDRGKRNGAVLNAVSAKRFMALGRRPPREAVGRDDRGPVGDEESLLEDLTRLRAQLSELRQKAVEFREKIRSGERENSKMDKLLQELLSKAKGGTGVSGSVLDQLREDLQALLRAKRQANEARQQLDEKESKLVSIKQIRQDLKDTKLSELEDDVHRAREEAKVKAEKLEAQGLYQGRPAEALHEEIVVAQNQVAEIHQKTAKLQDERVHFETMAKEHVEQTSNLEEKRYLVEQQKEQCEERLQELGDVERMHRQTKEDGVSTAVCR
ncbi:unnamed protein product [Cladocopium goreaui]|uniref:RING-type domain-containing protein n=1 Tax=Cladocopium goreaui TaxID=2562237 RepID=A0A9P1GJA5_9DINO|nr:unnamed protein product [Cladocopium goreaui]